jgi:hypothetical protein
VLLVIGFVDFLFADYIPDEIDSHHSNKETRHHLRFDDAI